MSHPPTNSPFTYSCGMVGHSLGFGVRMSLFGSGLGLGVSLAAVVRRFFVISALELPFSREHGIVGNWEDNRLIFRSIKTAVSV